MGKVMVPDDAMLYEEEIEMEPPRTASPQSPPDYSLDKGNKIIKNGTLSFEVTELEVTKTKIDSLLKDTNGYYENEQYHSYGNRIAYSLNIRVPNAKFGTLINKLENGVGKLKSKNISAKDVTKEYVDLNIRLENKLAYLKQYQTILLKAKSIKEILEVQEKIRRIEEEIESKKGRIKYLDNKVNFSTLNLEISELITGSIASKPSFGRRIINSFNNGAQGFLSFIVELICYWPFMLLLVFIYLARKPIWNRIRSKRKQTTDK